MIERQSTKLHITQPRIAKVYIDHLICGKRPTIEGATIEQNSQQLALKTTFGKRARLKVNFLKSRIAENTSLERRRCIRSFTQIRVREIHSVKHIALSFMYTAKGSFTQIRTTETC